MFRGGRKRPTFDTKVELIPVNRDGVGRSGGYGAAPPATYQAWGAPEVMTETTVANREAFVPTGINSGVQATNLGVFAWFLDGSDYIILFQPNDDEAAYYRVRLLPQPNWGAFRDAIGTEYEVTSEDANRPRTQDSWPHPQFIYIDPTGNTNYNLPPIEFSDEEGIGRYGILIDDATGQSLYYCNSIVHQCQHYRRDFGVPQAPTRSFLADVKDVAARESVTDGAVVATRTKSLMFAHASLRDLLDGEGSIAKEWKVRIGNREMDIIQVMDGWSPNLYTKLVVEDRR